jgi:hypothetical protein
MGASRRETCMHINLGTGYHATTITLPNAQISTLMSSSKPIS